MIECRNCGHCCHDMGKIYGTWSDALAFQNVGNTLIFHQTLIELSAAMEPGLHVCVIGEGEDPEVRMAMRGPCNAWDPETRMCDAHELAEYPPICANLLVAGADCRIFRIFNGMPTD